jgi:hypothetical protein
MSGSVRHAGAALGSLTCCLLLLGGCHALRFWNLNPTKVEKPEKEAVKLAAPGKHSLRVSQYVFLSDFELKRDLPLFQELSELREQVHRELKLPAANTVIRVHLFEDRDRYERFMKARYPDLPRRRAFFVAQPCAVGNTEDLLVFTYWGDRIQQDLRHELTHALLHSVLKDVPLWLDEGLAEYYELPPDRNGVNAAHLEHLLHGPNGPFRPNLARLEQLSQVQQMNPAEYREAWAWVHLMLHGSPRARQVLTEYLQQLRTLTPDKAGTLQPRLAAVLPAPDEALEKHLARLGTNHRGTEITETRHTESP